MKKRGDFCAFVGSILFIISLFFVLSSIVFAVQSQEFGFILSKEASEYHPIPFLEQFTHPFDQPVILTRFDAFGYSDKNQQPTYVKAVASYRGNVVVQGPCCYFRYTAPRPGGSYYSRCGAFTPNVIVDSVSLLECYPDRLTILDSYTLSYTQPIDQRRSSVSFTDHDKDLGAVQTFNVAGVPTVFIASDIAKVLVGFGPTYKKSTSDISEHIFACIDFNENSQCDYKEAETCITLGKDWSSITGTCVDSTQCATSGGMWMASLPAGSRCCGDSPSDQGIIAGDSTHGPSSFLCFRDSVQWQWMNADQYDFSIKNIGDSDVVSNAQRWFRCSNQPADNSSIRLFDGITPPGFGGYAERARAAKFLCASRSLQPQFLECCVPGSGDERACQNLPSSRAVPGDASSSLLSSPISKTFTTPDDTLEVSPLFMTDWKTAHSLHIIYKSSSDLSFSVEFFNGTQLLFSGNLTQYTLQSPLVNTWLHADVPVQSWSSITRIVFHFKTIGVPGQSIANIFTLHRLWLSLSSSELYCSGTRYLEGAVEHLWVPDLDTNVLGFDGQPSGKTSCNSIPAFGWTGTHCCGDDKEGSLGETFVDQSGGCWRGSTVFDGNTTDSQHILFSNQTFFGCPWSTFVSLPLIHRVEFCTVNHGLFCSVSDQRWSTEGGDGFTAWQRTSLKNSSVFGISSQSCCPSNHCWDGTRCIADMAGNSSAEPIRDYRCVQGQWVFTPIAFTWDKQKSGYCPRTTECLVDPAGNASLNGYPEKYYQGMKPQCIESNQTILDHYCTDGIWTSRTKLISLQLLDLVNRTGDPGRYVLFCDRYNTSLVDVGYSNILDFIIGPRVGAFRQPCVSTIGESCVNHFCVLDYFDTYAQQEKRAVAVSLNVPVNDPQRSFLYALGMSANSCNQLTGTGLFRQCSSSSHLWYSPELQSIVYSKDTLSFDGPSFFQIFALWLQSPVQTIIDWITGYQAPTQLQTDYNFTRGTSAFQRLYVAVRDGRHINAVQEDVNQRQFILARYQNISPSLCTYVQHKSVSKGITQNVARVSILCNTTGNVAHVFTDDPSAVELWPDFTSSLRVSSP